MLLSTEIEVDDVVKLEKKYGIKFRKSYINVRAPLPTIFITQGIYNSVYKYWKTEVSFMFFRVHNIKTQNH